MDPLTIRLSEDTLETLDAEREDGVSRSEYIRVIVASRHEHERIRDEYEAELQELRQDVERLEREKRLFIEDREEKQELVRYVEEERSAERRRREAGLLTRSKWFLFGQSDEEEA